MDYDSSDSTQSSKDLVFSASSPGILSVIVG